MEPGTLLATGGLVLFAGAVFVTSRIYEWRWKKQIEAERQQALHPAE